MMLTMIGPKTTATKDVTNVPNPNDWFRERVYAVSGNRLLEPTQADDITTRSSRIYLPTSTEQIAEIVQSNPKEIPIAIVCGGHEASNAALVADDDAIILDLAKMKNISLLTNDTTTEITVQSGVLFEELINFVRDHRGAIPLGSAPTVGVIGYIVNGGLSAFFSRRLGLLGQRVTRFTIVLPDGTILRDVTRENDPDLFLSVLGAGSAMGVVTEMSFTMAPESVIRSAAEFVAAFDTHDRGVQYSRKVLTHLRDHVLTDDGVSLELVYTAGNALVVTFVFYDTFSGDTADHLDALKKEATESGLNVVAEFNWTTWFEVASALWPVVNAISGNPLSMLQHSCGTKSAPSDTILDLIADVWILKSPLVESTIIEVRTLGGMVEELPKIPSGNVFHPFFADVIVIFDAQNKTISEVSNITTKLDDVLETAHTMEGLSVEVSGTHSQADDARESAMAEVIFGNSDMARTIIRTKQLVDPDDRFRFHPFPRIIAEAQDLVATQGPSTSSPTSSVVGALKRADQLVTMSLMMLIMLVLNLDNGDWR